MENSHMQHQVAYMKNWLIEQDFLDEQFLQLEELQDDANPNFVEEVVTLYFKDSSRLIVNIDAALERNPLDFNKLDSYMHQFKGSCSSIGAKKVKNECSTFKEYCEQGNRDGCLRTFQQLKKEHSVLRKKLETYFQLVRQAGPLHAASRPKYRIEKFLKYLVLNHVFQRDEDAKTCQPSLSMFASFILVILLIPNPPSFFGRQAPSWQEYFTLAWLSRQEYFTSAWPSRQEYFTSAYSTLARILHIGLFHLGSSARMLTKKRSPRQQCRRLHFSSSARHSISAAVPDIPYRQQCRNAH
ncbi:histidine phosphotransfer protein [Cinnamomum micranthum f. kanehirae]|uniref:Histidine-containing phosphotransfer protein n=1 Tax=Cinnamomum micranthum f. kanehirae TaxID=337451 RepID=A0A443N4T2_9MAGN|nr:histidine phosphotransfer protein [Cinnamomum micranthum f. kanehirae]